MLVLRARIEGGSRGGGDEGEGRRSTKRPKKREEKKLEKKKNKFCAERWKNPSAPTPHPHVDPFPCAADRRCLTQKEGCTRKGDNRVLVRFLGGQEAAACLRIVT